MGTQRFEEYLPKEIFHLRLKTTHCWIFIRLSARGDEMTEKVQDVDVDTEKVHNWSKFVLGISLNRVIQYYQLS